MIRSTLAVLALVLAHFTVFASGAVLVRSGDATALSNSEGSGRAAAWVEPVALNEDDLDNKDVDALASNWGMRTKADGFMRRHMYKIIIGLVLVLIVTTTLWIGYSGANNSSDRWSGDNVVWQLDTHDMDAWNLTTENYGVAYKMDNIVTVYGQSKDCPTLN